MIAIGSDQHLMPTKKFESRHCAQALRRCDEWVPVDRPTGLRDREAGGGQDMCAVRPTPRLPWPDYISNILGICPEKEVRL